MFCDEVSFMKQQFRVIIAGSRNFDNYEFLKQKVDHLLSNVAADHEVHIVCGGARGADTLGAQYARERGYIVDLFPADWDKYGKSAGYRRNVQMAENADAVIVFWDGSSRGSKHMIEIANQRKLPCRIVRF